MNFYFNLDRLPTEHSLFMHQEKGTKYPMKLETLTPSRVLKDHLRRTCLLINLVRNNRSLLGLPWQ